MGNSDTQRYQAADITIALGLLTRLPITVDAARAKSRGAKSAWAYPLAGLLIGGIAAVIASLCDWVGLAPALVALIALATTIVLTGAMHEDGFADCADGFWGGWSREQRLDIMKDSHIGVYGVLALGLSLLLRWSALVIWIEADAIWAALLLPAVSSRAAMVWIMHSLPPARATGLSRSVGVPSRDTALAAGALAAMSCAMIWPAAILVMALVSGIVILGVSRLARAKIGGQTGDVLGGTQQLTEIAVLVVLSGWLNGS